MLMYFPSGHEPIHIRMIQDLLFIQIGDFLRETVYMVKNEDDRTVRLMEL